MKYCPRCGEKSLNLEECYNVLSRRDNKTYICCICGQEEAFIDGGITEDKCILERDKLFIVKLNENK